MTTPPPKPLPPSVYECSLLCGYITTTAPRMERCNFCGVMPRTNREFCSQCGKQDFADVCPQCGADVVVDHPDTLASDAGRAALAEMEGKG
mgnify:CR=1 FL=1